MLRRALLRSVGPAVAVASVGMVGCNRTAARGSATREPAAGSPDVASDDDAFASLVGFCNDIAPPAGDEHFENLERLQWALDEAGYDALVVEPGATMQYLTGVRWGRSERPFLLVVPRASHRWWVVPAFEERTAREHAIVDGAVVRVWQEHESPYAAVAAGLAGHPEWKVAVEPQMRHFVVEGLREALGTARVVDGTAVVDRVRMRKHPAELLRLRRANEATKAALQLVARTAVREGMLQSELAEHVRRAQEQAGLTDVWVLALFGPNAAFPHGTASDRALHEGDLVLVDTGGSLHGYRSDITRTWALGTPPEPARRAWSVVAEAQRAALDAILPGVTCGDVDAAARAVIEAAGFGAGYHRFTHRLGHGIGLEVHEHPYLVPGSLRILEPGMTMSVEPGIYEPGAFGVRIEDIVVVTDDGCEVFGPRVESLDPSGWPSRV
jgi:Xaa-Pro dipeptidase